MNRSHILYILIIMVIAAAFIVPSMEPARSNLIHWGIFTAVLAVLVCLALFLEFEKAVTSSKEIALIAMLGTISAVLRIPFAAIPSVQPCTYLIICTGYVFGPIAGFTVGAVTVIVSNFFLGHGPWTLYQIIAWGLAGLSAGYLGKYRINTIMLVAFGVVWGYLYGFITNIWYWTTFIYPLTPKTLAVTQINTLWFDTFHAICNGVFLAVLGQKTLSIFNRFKDRFSLTLEHQ